MSYQVEEVGIKNTDSYRIFIKKTNNTSKEAVYVSPFHDIPLYTQARGVYRMVVEIPRWTNAKMEICKTEPFNPIRQDTKKGKLRFVDNCFPYHGFMWNYGALPQTWEMPSFMHPGIDGCKGDNDPIDVCEIGSKVHSSGSVVDVKILGALAMIDEGEVDWKMIAIDVNDPLAEKLNDLSDLKIHTPGLLKATLEWFRIYKVPTGSAPNKFAFDEQFQDREAAIEVVNLAHTLWKKLIDNDLDSKANNSENFKLFNTDLNDENNYKKTTDEAKTIVNEFKTKLTPTITQQVSEANTQLQKVFYLSKKDIKPVTATAAATENSKKKETQRNEDGIIANIINFIKEQNINLLIPIALSTIVGYLIFSFYK